MSEESLSTDRSGESSSGSGNESQEVEQVPPASEEPLPSVPKLLLIVICYTMMGYGIGRMVAWFHSGWRQGTDYVDFITWMQCDNCGPTIYDVIKVFAFDIALFSLFGAQHSLLATRNLIGTWYYKKVFVEWKVNKCIYSLLSGLTIWTMVEQWRITPVYIWHYPGWDNIFSFIHMLMWIALYGSSLMQDLPDLVGLDQAVLVDHSPRKSERYLRMLREQRHMGFVPFTILTLATDFMTLDRLLFLIVSMCYTYRMWKQPGSESYQYVREMSQLKLERMQILNRIEEMEAEIESD